MSKQSETKVYMVYIKSTKLDKVEQMQLLYNELSGRRSSIAACRGLLGLSQVNMFEQWIDNATSVTQAMKKHVRMTTDCRVVMYQLAKLKRDGHSEAFEQLKSALEVPQYIMDREVFQIEETRPVTVLMLQPEMTWTMISMMIGHSSYSRQMQKDVRRHFPAFQEMKEKFSRSTTRSDRRGQEYPLVYRQRVTSQFDSTLFEGAEELHLDFGQVRRGVPHDIPLGYLYDGLSAAQVLSRWSPGHCSCCETWEFRIPKFLEHFKVGLHPRICHPKWCESHPALASIEESSSRFAGLIVPTAKRANYVHYQTRYILDQQGEVRYMDLERGGFLFVSSAEKRFPAREFRHDEHIGDE